MATPTIIVLVTVAVITVVALVVAIVFMLQEVKRLTGTVRSLREDLEPSLAQLGRDAEIAQHELERVSQSAQAVARQRAQER